MYFANPGGDKIGRRRLDTHFRGICNLGANYTFDSEKKAYRFETQGPLQGTYMLLDEAILLDYEEDFSKHAPSNEVPRIRMVWKRERLS